MIVGNPLKLSAFGSRNREFQVECIRVTLNLSERSFVINSSFKLQKGYSIFINAYCPQKNHEFIKVEIESWSEKNIDFRFQLFDDSNDDSTSEISMSSESSDSEASGTETESNVPVLVRNGQNDMTLMVCILRSDYEKLRIDEYSLKIIEDNMLMLTEENYDNDKFII